MEPNKIECDEKKIRDELLQCVKNNEENKQFSHKETIYAEEAINRGIQLQSTNKWPYIIILWVISFIVPLVIAVIGFSIVIPARETYIIGYFPKFFLSYPMISFLCVAIINGCATMTFFFVDSIKLSNMFFLFLQIALSVVIYISEREIRDKIGNPGYASSFESLEDIKNFLVYLNFALGLSFATVAQSLLIVIVKCAKCISNLIP